MAYTRRQAEWKNYPDTTTPIRAEDLNAIEGGLVDAAGVADTALGLASSAASRAEQAIASVASVQGAADAASASASAAAGLATAAADAATGAIVGQVELQPMIAVGHSWVDGTGPALWWNRVANRLRMGTATNNGWSGRTVCDVAMMNLKINGTRAWVPRTKALIGAVCTINDVTVWDGSAASVVGYKHAWRALLSMLTANGVVAADTSSFVYSAGGWSTETVAQTSVQGTGKASTGAKWWKTSTIGGYFEFTFTGTAVDVFLIARATGAGLVTFTEGATTLGTLDLTAATAQDTPAVFRIAGRSPGTHTIRGTLASGASMTVDSYRVPLTTPAPGVVLGEPELIPAAGDQSTWLADVETMKGHLAAIVAEFPSFTYLDLSSKPGWDKATMTLADGKHPNDLGCAWIASKVIDALRSMPYSTGLNATATSYPAAYAAPAGPAVPSGGSDGTGVVVVDDPFNRADNATSLGTALTGQAWAVDNVWGISGNTAKQISGGSGFATVDAGTADVTVTATVTAISAAKTGGIGIRVQDVNNCGAYLILNPAGYIFGRRVAGHANLATSSVIPVVGDVLKIVASGSVVTAYVNGVQIGTHPTLTTYQTLTRHGLWGQADALATQWDNFKVTA